jgi:fido (protein-threonine AMPylation protein)
MGYVHESARAIANHGASLDAPALAYRLARLYADYNHIHPFREGNGRAGTLLLHTVAALCGRRLDLSSVSREEWYLASRDSAVSPRWQAQPPAVPAAARQGAGVALQHASLCQSITGANVNWCRGIPRSGASRARRGVVGIGRVPCRAGRFR